MKKYQIKSIHDATGGNNVLYDLVDDQQKVARISSIFGSLLDSKDLDLAIFNSVEMSIKVCAIANYLTHMGFPVIRHFGSELIRGSFYNRWSKRSVERDNIPAQILSKEKGLPVYDISGTSLLEKRLANLELKVKALPYIRKPTDFQAIYTPESDELKLMDFDEWEIDPALLEAY